MARTNGEAGMKLTEWFGPNVKPVHFGVYQIEASVGGEFFNIFDGHTWHWGWDTVEDAYCGKHNPMSLEKVVRWRGLAEKPE